MILDLANIGSAPVTVVTPPETASRTAFPSQEPTTSTAMDSTTSLSAHRMPTSPPNRPDADKSYVVFGQAGGLPATVNLAMVATCFGGFIIHGENMGDHSGYSVSSAGELGS